eukprot:6213011-Prymnesium_polylepis.1
MGRSCSRRQFGPSRTLQLSPISGWPQGAGSRRWRPWRRSAAAKASSRSGSAPPATRPKPQMARARRRLDAHDVSG